MSGVACDQCGKELNVVVTGGKFQVRDGSTLDNLNFQKLEEVKIITLDDDTEEGEHVTQPWAAQSNPKDVFHCEDRHGDDLENTEQVALGFSKIGKRLQCEANHREDD